MRHDRENKTRYGLCYCRKGSLLEGSGNMQIAIEREGLSWRFWWLARVRFADRGFKWRLVEEPSKNCGEQFTVELCPDFKERNVAVLLQTAFLSGKQRIIECLLSLRRLFYMT